MKTLIDELVDEHIALTELLQRVKQFGISTEKGRESLLKAKNTLLNHLRKEDEKLYPILRNAAKENQTLSDLLNVFARDMDSVSSFALDFFKKYENAQGSLEFAKDFGQLYASLGNRIRKEESILYQEYSKVI